MAGHSKWSKIKRQKAKEDKARSKLFSKLSKKIAIAARKDDDPETNPDLQFAIDKAQDANMPNDTIERAIKRGTGELGTGPIEEVTYEGYGPGGVAVIVECATDNRNRASSEVKHAFDSHGGNLAESGSATYQFDRRGIITVETGDLEEASLDAIEAGAVDVGEDEDTSVLTVYTAGKDLHAVKDQLEEQGWEVSDADLGYVANNVVTVADESTAKKTLKLMEALDDLEDVSDTYSNFDIPEELAAAIG